MRKKTLSYVVATIAFITTGSFTVSAAEKIKKEKLQIVFCFGQSNMVGLASVPTAWYMIQPQYIPHAMLPC